MTQEQGVAIPAGELAIRHAQPEDADAIAAIHDDTMRWAFARGFRESGPPGNLREDALRRIGEDEVYIAWHAETPAATLTLAWDHPTVWGDLPAEAGYVYAFATSRAFAGRQVGLSLLQWAEQYIAASGKERVRLECRANNPGLRSYYERTGYVWRGDLQVGTGTLARYEKALRADGQGRER